MSPAHGLWLVVVGKQAERVERSIERKLAFSKAVSRSSVHPKVAELVLGSLSSKSIDFIGVSTRGRRVATDDETVSIGHVSRFKPIDTSEIRSTLASRFRTAFERLCESGPERRVSPALWAALLRAIRELRPSVTSELSASEQLIAESLARRDRRDDPSLESLERDAVLTAVDVFGGSVLRKRVVERSAEKEKGSPAPFLSRLRSVSVLEDTTIQHDQRVFPGFEFVRDYQVGAVELRSGRERLTIVNCNRLPLEQTLGVDLIYYNHVFHSFVLVQYKRMTRTSSTLIAYRPNSDKNYESELARMTAADAKLRSLPIGAADPDIKVVRFRLSSRPFYFKLCDSVEVDPLDVRLSPGIYLPLGLWRRLMGSSSVRGVRRGRLVGMHNCHRYLTNTEFSRLVRGGWIGSRGNASSHLSSIIEATLGAGRMAVVAFTSRAPATCDYPRDSLGQFVSDDSD